jgi:hypothetical protein
MNIAMNSDLSTKNTLGRLAALPSIFNATDALLRTGIAPKQLNQVMWRWKNSGYVRPVGSRADVWFNLVVDPVVSRERWEEAVRMALPEAILAGHGVLMRSGLSTQMSHSDYMIRPARTASASIEGVELHERPAVWVRKLRQAHAVKRTGGLSELDPGAALADLVKFEPDSIDFDEIDWDEMSSESMAIFHKLAPDFCEQQTNQERSAWRDCSRPTF